MRSPLTVTGKLLRNRNFILILAIVLGMAIGEKGAIKIEPLVLPLLAVVMTVSALNVSSRLFVTFKDMPRIILYSMLLNYVILGGIMLLMTQWLIHDQDLWKGFIVLAVVPPAPGIVPFSYALGGDVRFALIGLTAAYLAALIIMPLSLVYFFGTASFDPLNLLILVIELVLIPIIVSRILLYAKADKYLERWRGLIVNWCFFLVIFALIGLNRRAFFSDYEALIRTGIIAIATTFVLGYIIERVGKAFHLKLETLVTVILMGTAKNFGLAGGLVLSLFGDRAAIPSAVSVFFGILMLVWLGFRLKKPG